MKKKFIELVFSFIFILAVACTATFAQTSNGKHCLVYEPAIVNLQGKLIKKAVINVSEQTEFIWVLKLEDSVCIAADKENEINSAFARITEVQLVLTKEQLKKYRGSQNQKITASGTLFAGHTQHHFTDVLMMVVNFKK